MTTLVNYSFVPFDYIVVCEVCDGSVVYYVHRICVPLYSSEPYFYFISSFSSYSDLHEFFHSL